MSPPEELAAPEDAAMDEPSSSQIPRERRSQAEINQVFVEIMASLKSIRTSPLAFLMHVLRANKSDDLLFYSQDAIYRNTLEENLHELLDTLSAHKRGHHIMGDWMRTKGLPILCDVIHEEMESVKQDLYMSTTVTTPEFLDGWDINSIMEPVQAKTPTWTAILAAATDPKVTETDSDADDKRTKDRPMVRLNTKTVTKWPVLITDDRSIGTETHKRSSPLYPFSFLEQGPNGYIHCCNSNGCRQKSY